MADEVQAVHRLGDEAERRHANHEHAEAEGHRTQAAKGAHAAVGIFVFARLGEVVALQGAEHIANGDQLARQVRSDDVAQGGDVARLKILELHAGTAAGRVEGAHLELDVHGQAELVDGELQAPA
ncbi:hypothetical protein D3C84_750830 [compost metagenome]